MDARDVLNAHVLSRLDDGDLAVLATVNRKMRDVVFESPVGDVRDVAAVRRQLARVRNFVGSVARLAWAKDQRGCPWDPRTFECIAMGGNVEVARWAKERGCPWNEMLAPEPREAATWRCCSGCGRSDAPLDEWTCAYAASGGHLEVLQWARANGAPWDERLAPKPREGGHLEVLQWARANGRSVDRRTCRLCRERRPPGGAAVGARERRSVGRGDLRRSRTWRPLGGTSVGARERRSVGRADLRRSRARRPP